MLAELLNDVEEDLRKAEAEWQKKKDTATQQAAPVSFWDMIRQGLTETPEQAALRKHGMKALSLMTSGSSDTARQLLQFLLQKSDMWMMLASQRDEGAQWPAMFAALFEELIKQCDAQGLLGTGSLEAPLQRRHLLLLRETARVCQPLGEAKLPREITWIFLRNPCELALLSDSHLHAISLQNGRVVHSQRIDSEPSKYFLLTSIMVGKKANSASIARQIGLGLYSRGAPHVDNLITSARLPLYWRVQDDRVTVAGPPLSAFLSDKVVLKEGNQSCTLLRLGHVAISESEGWFACWAGQGTSTIMLGDLSSDACHILKVEEHTIPVEWEMFELVAQSKYLFAANDCLLEVFEIKREGASFSWWHGCHTFETDCYHVGIASMCAKDTMVAALIQSDHGRLYSRVDLLDVSSGDHPAGFKDAIDFTLLQRVYGSHFTDVQLAGDLILTITSEPPFLVQAWPVTGPPQCLLQLGGITEKLAAIFVKPQGSSCTIGAKFVQPDQPANEADQDVEQDQVIVDAGVAENFAEEAQIILPEEAERIAGELQTSGIERIIASGTEGLQGPDAEEGIRAIVVTFSRHSPELENALMTSSLARSAIDLGIDVKPPWANGAKVFVQGVPEGFFEDLRPWHVILYEEEEASLHAALQPLPFNFKKTKPQGKCHVPHALTFMNVSDDDDFEEVSNDAVPVIEYVVRNTFLELPQDQYLDTRSVQTA